MIAVGNGIGVGFSRGNIPWQLRLKADATNPTFALQFDRQRSAVLDVRTNYVYNSTFAGVTNINLPNMIWVDTQAGITKSFIGTGVEDGMSYVDLRFSGTATNTNGHNIYLTDTSCHPAALSGQSWTMSIYARIVGGSTTNLSGVYVGIDELTSGNSYLANTSLGIVSTLSSTLQRFSVSRTLNNASTAKTVAKFDVRATNGTAIDITIRIYAPQFEMRSVATEYIPTSAGALTVSSYEPKAVSDVLTITRSSTKLVYNSSGLLTSVGANLPAYDYDPVTGGARGILVEGSRQNLMTYSEDLSNAAWVVGQATKTLDAAVSDPKGAAGSVYKIVEDTTAATYHHVYSSGFISPSGTSTISVYAKAGTRTKFGLSVETSGNGRVVIFDLAAKSFTASSQIGTGGTVTSLTGALIEQLPNGWFRCSVVAVTSGTNRFACKMHNGTSISYTGDGASYMYFWGAQVEVGSFPTSYIPTTSAAVTRTADVIVNNSATTVPFASWYNQTEGTVLVNFSRVYQGPTGFPPIFNINDSTSNEFIESYVNEGASNVVAGKVVDGGVTQMDVGGTQYYTLGTPAKSTLAYELNNCAKTINGLTVVTDTSATIPTVTRLCVGTNQATSSFFYGHIRALYYYPIRVSNAELQRITTL